MSANARDRATITQGVADSDDLGDVAADGWNKVETLRTVRIHPLENDITTAQSVRLWHRIRGEGLKIAGAAGDGHIGVDQLHQAIWSQSIDPKQIGARTSLEDKVFPINQRDVERNRAGVKIPALRVPWNRHVEAGDPRYIAGAEQRSCAWILDSYDAAERRCVNRGLPDDVENDCGQGITADRWFAEDTIPPEK